MIKEEEFTALNLSELVPDGAEWADLTDAEKIRCASTIMKAVKKMRDKARGILENKECLDYGQMQLLRGEIKMAHKVLSLPDNARKQLERLPGNAEI